MNFFYLMEYSGTWWSVLSRRLKACHTQKKRVPKQYPWDTIATNDTLFSKEYWYSLFLNWSLGYRNSIPRRILYYRQSNSTPSLRKTVYEYGQPLMSIGIYLVLLARSPWLHMIVHCPGEICICYHVS